MKIECPYCSNETKVTYLYFLKRHCSGCGRRNQFYKSTIGAKFNFLVRCIPISTYVVLSNRTSWTERMFGMNHNETYIVGILLFILLTIVLEFILYNLFKLKMSITGAYE